MRRRAVLIPAQHIREKIDGRIEIEEAVNDILQLVSSDIEDSVENGRNYAATILESTFNVPYMTNMDARRKIYFYVASALIDVNYNPKIYVDKQRNRFVLYTSWQAKKQSKVDEYEANFLRSITLDEPMAPIPEPATINIPRGRQKRHE